MSLAERAERFARAVGAFLDPGDPARARYLAASPHFHPDLLSRSLERSLRPWADPARLVEALQAECAAPPGVTLVPPERVAVVLGGVVAASHVQAMAYPWLHGASLALKAPAADPLFPALFADALGERVTWVSEADRALAGADAAVVVGSDAAVRALQPLLRPSAPFLGFGHRQSAACVGAADALDALALDVGLYDQRGCLSVGEVLVPEGEGEVVAARLGAALSTLPPRHRGADEDALRRFRELAVLRGDALSFCGDAVVRLVRGGGVEPTPGGRFVTVREVPDRLAALAPLAGALGTLVVGDAAPVSLHRLARLGASRVVAPGEAQAAGPEWPHDGVAPWALLCRRIRATARSRD